MVSDRAFIFHIYILWGKTLSLVPKSRSWSHIKVTVFQKKKKKAISQAQLVLITFILLSANAFILDQYKVSMVSEEYKPETSQRFL